MLARMLADSTLIILIAPNVSEQKGGEGIKALQIFRELSKAHPNAVQITHARNRAELTDRLGLPGVEFVADTPLMVLLWKTVVLRWLIDPLFFRKAVALAESVAARRGKGKREVIIHQTEPNSPVIWRSLSRRHANVFGPINGNIYYPAAFRRHETATARLRRRLHFPLQWLNSLLPRGLKAADLIFYAGGERSRISLLAAGCSERTLLSTLDCGIPEELLARPRIQHQGTNHRFVHYGRLMFHKGTALVIESLTKTNTPVSLDIIGRGPELQSCQRLVKELRLEGRVRFLDWYPNRDDLFGALSQYRGVVLPTIEDANGIVVQEAMTLGLPPICLDWGGPQLLIEHGVSGFLVPPADRTAIVSTLAAHMDRLSLDPGLAESMSRSSRERATTWRWPTLIQDWLRAYPHH
jgi:glycosyltransferase involved in cell wall biosynthesis